MLERAIAEALVWAMRGGIAWFIACEYLSYVEEKLAEVSRALNTLGRLGAM